MNPKIGFFDIETRHLFQEIDKNWFSIGRYEQDKARSLITPKLG